MLFIIIPLKTRQTHFPGRVTKITTYFLYIQDNYRRLIDRELAKKGSFQHSKRSDNKWCTVEVRWSIFMRIWLYFYIPKRSCKYSHTNPYNFAMTLISLCYVDSTFEISGRQKVRFPFSNSYTTHTHVCRFSLEKVHFPRVSPIRTIINWQLIINFNFIEPKVVCTCDA